MKQTCVAIDDEPLALDLIRTYIGRLQHLHLLATFDDAIEGQQFLQKKPVDLLFIDINMPDISGIQLVRSLQHKPVIVFTTAYKDFAYEGYELDAVDYLLKPVAFDRFEKAVLKAKELFEYRQRKPEDTGELYVRAEYKLLRISFNDILYIEGLEDYIRIHLVSGRPIMTLSTLKAVIEKLPANRFQRIHRSYIVSLQNIQAIVSKKLILTNGTSLPLSDTYSDVVANWKKNSR